LELESSEKILDLPRNLYLGATWSNGETNQATVSGLVTHNFNKDWKLNLIPLFKTMKELQRYSNECNQLQMVIETTFKTKT
jgi:outer membrane receptor for ferric coprogen and ferric-rhodotorulic acid